MSGRWTPNAFCFFFSTIFFWGISVFVYHLERHNGMGQNLGQQQNFAHAQSLPLLGLCSIHGPSRRRLLRFLCALKRSYWNIPGTCFDIYAVTGTAWNSRIENSFATNSVSITSWNSRGSFRSGSLSRRDSLRSYWRSFTSVTDDS